MGDQTLPTATPSKKSCFVVMGFGRKADYATGRTLDLDKTYKYLIKPVAVECGLSCFRADEIAHSGPIEVPMFEHLLSADLVIADLSTANPNAFYELGIRHALRPRTTVIISESKLPYPFDVNHISIMSYVHMGDWIDVEEAESFKKRLKTTLEAVLSAERPDSPVYTFLQNLSPPNLRKAVEEAFEATSVPTKGMAAAAAPGEDARSLAQLIEDGEAALARDNFERAKASFRAALQKDDPNQAAFKKDSPNQAFLRQRLALATYKSKKPTHVDALKEALRVLQPLGPERSLDPETLGLAGAIEKRLFDEGQGPEHLSLAIKRYERGYYIKRDYYNGINLAYLVNEQVGFLPTAPEKIANLVCANRVRREVLALCEEQLALLKEDRSDDDRNRRYWLLATMAEAYYGLNDLTKYEDARAAAKALSRPKWMEDSTDAQIEKLKKLLAPHADVLQAINGSTKAQG